jgi:hypothetical protein
MVAANGNDAATLGFNVDTGASSMNTLFPDVCGSNGNIANPHSMCLSLSIVALSLSIAAAAAAPAAPAAAAPAAATPDVPVGFSVDSPKDRF